MGIRERQKGIKCRAEGCDGWCRSKGLCPKHGMALMRYGDIAGGKSGTRKGVCGYCKQEMIIVKAGQVYHRGCYRKSPQGRKAAYEATKAYRNRNREKVNARGIFRRHPMQKDDKCLVCNTDKELHRHHHNYKNKMDVIVLCKDHHRELHSWDNRLRD